MDALWKYLFDNTPALGAAVAAIAIILGFVVFPFLIKALGLVIGDKSKLVGKEEIKPMAGGVDDIKDQLTGVEERLAALESGFERRLAELAHEVKNRPTREEIHRLELSFTRMEGRFESLDNTSRANSASLTRIEDQMYAAAVRLREGRGA